MQQARITIVAAVSVCMVAPGAAAAVRAFPTAEGFGAHAKGGRGGRVLFVTNLNDDGPGSLRAAVETKGPRFVLFRVSGVIELKSNLNIREPRITIAGQTAPGGGICLKNHSLTIRTQDVIVRHLRIRPGDEPGPAYKARGKSFEPDAISISRPSRDVIVDHCSASWAIDECLSVSGEGITNVTVQWCMITESLNNSFHEKGAHGYGSLIRTNGSVSFHHNLYAHHQSRSPRPGTYGEGSILFDFRNNVICDTYGYSAEDPVRMNYVGNFIRRPRGSAFRIGGDATRLYVADNHLDGDRDRNRDPWSVISRAEARHKMSKPFPAAPVTTQDARSAFEAVMQSAGATRPRRDAVDARVIEQVRKGTGGLIDSQKQVGGWPILRSAAAPKDSDHDGMPDDWERRHRLQPTVADAHRDADRDGYTNLEEFLNNTSPRTRNR